MLLWVLALIMNLRMYAALRGPEVVQAFIILILQAAQEFGERHRRRVSVYQVLGADGNQTLLEWVISALDPAHVKNMSEFIQAMNPYHDGQPLVALSYTQNGCVTIIQRIASRW